MPTYFDLTAGTAGLKGHDGADSKKLVHDCGTHNRVVVDRRMWWVKCFDQVAWNYDDGIHHRCLIEHFGTSGGIIFIIFFDKHPHLDLDSGWDTHSFSGPYAEQQRQCAATPCWSDGSRDDSEPKRMANLRRMRQQRRQRSRASLWIHARCVVAEFEWKFD